MNLHRTKQTLNDGDFSIIANEYGHYCMPNRYAHRQISKLLMGGGVYEPATLRFLRRHLGSGDVITGGAFIGDFFPALHEVLAETSQIHSFEPNPVSFDAALKTIAVNGLKRVQLHPVAVGDQPDTLMLQVSRHNGKAIAAGERIVDDMDVSDARGLPVSVRRIDDLVDKDRMVTVLHLDVEGFETKALQGAKRVLTANRPLVLLEAGRPWQQRHFCAVLNDLVEHDTYTQVGVIERNAIYRAL